MKITEIPERRFLTDQENIQTPDFSKAVTIPVYVPKNEIEAKQLQEYIDAINLRDGVK